MKLTIEQAAQGTCSEIQFREKIQKPTVVHKIHLTQWFFTVVPVNDSLVSNQTTNCKLSIIIALSLFYNSITIAVYLNNHYHYELTFKFNFKSESFPFLFVQCHPPTSAYRFSSSLPSPTSSSILRIVNEIKKIEVFKSETIFY